MLFHLVVCVHMQSPNMLKGCVHRVTSKYLKNCKWNMEKLWIDILHYFKSSFK